MVRSQAAGSSMPGPLGSGESSMKCPWVSLGALLVAQIAYGADRFDSALARARENESSPAGEAYARSISGPFGNEVWKAMKRCFPMTRRVPWTPPYGFTLVFAVRDNGSLSNLSVRPLTSETECIRDSIRSFQVAKPPADNWWSFIAISPAPPAGW